MTFNHSGSYLASADKSGIIKYFEPNMNNLTAWQGSNSREAIRDISFSPDDQRFATASDDSSIRIWSFAESRVESVLTGESLSQTLLSSYQCKFSRSWLGREMRTMASHKGFDCFRVKGQPHQVLGSPNRYLSLHIVSLLPCCELLVST